MINSGEIQFYNKNCFQRILSILSIDNKLFHHREDHSHSEKVFSINTLQWKLFLPDIDTPYSDVTYPFMILFLATTQAYICSAGDHLAHSFTMINMKATDITSMGKKYNIRCTWSTTQDIMQNTVFNLMDLDLNKSHNIF